MGKNKDNKEHKQKEPMTKKKKIIVTIVTIITTLTLLGAAAILVVFGLLFGFDIPNKPKVKTGEFPFELVYEYNGEQFTIKESIVCEYEGIEWSIDGGSKREWNCYITNYDSYGQFYLDEEKHHILHIQIPLNADYWMGDPTENEEFATPYIFFIDESTGTTYFEQDLSAVVGAKIVSWTPSEVLVGNIKE